MIGECQSKIRDNSAGQPVISALLPRNNLLLLTALEAAATCRASVRTWRSWDAAGRVPRAIRIGPAKLWRPEELVDWIAAGCPPRSSWEWEPRISEI